MSNTRWTMSALQDTSADGPESRKSHDAEGSKHSADHGIETILLVEDKSASRERLATALAAKGYSVFTAADGVEAVELFRSFEGYVDLVVIDQSLPRQSGFDAAVTIRNINPDVKVILMAAETESQMTDEMREWGIDEILVKPFTMKSAVKIIRSVLDRNAT